MASVREQRTILPAFPLFTSNPFLQSHREGSPAALATKPANALFFNGVLTAPDGINRLVRDLIRPFEAELFAFFIHPRYRRESQRTTCGPLCPLCSIH
jgi:hypothetical protein